MYPIFTPPSSWSDYTPIADPLTGYHAEECVKISFVIDPYPAPHIIPYVRHDPAESWYVPSKATDILLQHEMGHFYLLAGYCLRIAISSYGYPVDGLAYLLSIMPQSLADLNAEYDAITDHGRTQGDYTDRLKADYIRFYIEADRLGIIPHIPSTP